MIVRKNYLPNSRISRLSVIAFNGLQRVFLRGFQTPVNQAPFATATRSTRLLISLLCSAPNSKRFSAALEIVD